VLLHLPCHNLEEVIVSGLRHDQRDMISLQEPHLVWLRVFFVDLIWSSGHGCRYERTPIQIPKGTGQKDTLERKWPDLGCALTGLSPTTIMTVSFDKSSAS